MFPGSTLSDHVLRFNNIPQVYQFTLAAVGFLLLWLSSTHIIGINWFLEIECYEYKLGSPNLTQNGRTMVKGKG